MQVSMRRALSTLAALAMFICAATAATAEPLPSWNDGPARSAITDFVHRVTDRDSPDYVPPAERIAVFDNDGTLWSEQPVYFQLAFALDRVRRMAPERPEWKETEPFKSAIAGDLEGLKAGGMDGLMKIVAASHAGMTAENFADSVAEWAATARHPATNLRYTRMVYQPMLELLDYLRANGFKTFIVSGGGVDFMRVFAEEVYGIPPEQVVGTTPGSHFELKRDVPVIVKDPQIVLLDDKAGKPIGIYRHIGRRPILAAGNSDGDLQMLQYTTIPRDVQDTGARLGLLVRHTDAEREFAYDRESHIGKLDKALDEAPERGWVVVDMKKDWERIYPAGGE